MNRIFTLMIIAALSGCSTKMPRPLNDNEKAEITDAVINSAHAITEACNQINFLNFKNFFIESPEFLTITPGGSHLDYSKYMKGERDFFESVSTLQLTILNENVIALEKTVAVYTVRLKVIAVLKTGKTLTYENNVYSEVYKKTDNQWRIIFIQEAGQPPVTTN
jgi:hypothetical protein